MKCPDCYSENYGTIDIDPVIMSCDDCHCFHSVSWSTGFWVGFIQNEHNDGVKESFFSSNIRKYHEFKNVLNKILK